VLTATLYGGDVRVRIRQEAVLGIGGLRALEALGVCPGAVHLNEGHSAFAVLELARVFMQREGRSFEDVREKVAAMTVFTTHTPVAAGHDRFEPDLVEQTLGPLREELGIPLDRLLSLGRVDPDQADERFCMTVLALRMSHRRNAVSARHGRVTRAMWKGLWPDLPEDRVPIGHITNGVHVHSWLALTMAPLFERRLGLDWESRSHEERTWQAIDAISDSEFWEQQQILKARLIDYVGRCLRRQAARWGGGEPGPGAVPALNPDFLTIGFARRFAAYKRADLLLSDLDRLAKIVNHPDRPVQIIYAGKAHPHDEDGKRLIQKIVQLTRDKRFAGRIAVLEDYDMNVGRHLVQAPTSG